MISIKEKINIGQPDNNLQLDSRARLNNLLFKFWDKNLVLVYSPAGYGKTAAISDYIKCKKINAAWLTLSEDVHHIYTFFIYAVQALKTLNENFGGNTLQLIKSRREKANASKSYKTPTAELVSTFINEFRKYFKTRIILVVDDFQNLDETPWTKAVFKSLIRQFPENLQMILVSRQVPDFDFIPLIKKGKMARIGMEELVFRTDEIKSLLGNVYCIRETKKGMELLAKNLGGWITGIHLVLQTFGGDYEKFNIEEQKIPENIFNYLAEEVYKKLDPLSQKFLLYTSALENFDRDICSYIKDIGDSDSVFNELIKKNILIQTNGHNGSNGSSYSYHKFFKTFLTSKLRNHFPKVKSSDYKNVISEYYFSRNDIVSGISFLFRIKDYSGAIPLVLENFNKLLREGKFEVLWKWFTYIDKDTINSNAYLLCYYGLLNKYFAGELETALEYIQKSIDLLRKNNETESSLILRCYTNKANLLISLGRIQDVISEITDVIHEQSENEHKAVLQYYLAFAYYQNAQYVISNNLLRQSLETSIKAELSENEKNIYILLGHINLIKGEYKKSTHYYEKIESLSPNILDKFETLCNLVLLYAQSANYRKAKQNLDKLEETIENYPSPIFRIPYMLAKQAYYYEKGEYETCRDILSEIHDKALTLNHVNYLYLSTRLLSDSYFHMNDIENSQKYLQEATQYLNRKNELEMVEIASVKALLQKSKIESMSEKTDPEVEAALLFARDFYISQNLIYSQVQIDYHLADYYHNIGKSRNSMKFLKECLKISREKDYISHLYRGLKSSERLFKFALSNKIEEEFINRLFVNCPRAYH